MAINDAEIRFKASLEDDVSPKAAKLEDQLKKMGATPIEIKMMMKAVDDATPKMKEMQKEIDKLKRQQIHFTAVSDAKDHIDGIKRASAEPIKLNFVDNLKETSDRLFSLRANVPTNIGGLNVRGLGAGAGIAGLAAGAAGVMQQGVQVNSDREQSMVTLTQTLKDNTMAQREMGKLVKISQETPFNYKDVLQADVRLRSYQIPSMKGEGGPNNQGWLKPAGDMAAAMNTPITQAVEAIADARQGYFVRMMSYGIRMMREDFQAGGKYAGQSFEGGLEKAIRRFEGAQEMQSKTFKGVMSNLQDVFQNQFLKPIGEPAFNVAKNVAQNMQDKFNDPAFQKQLGENIQKLQRGMVDFYDSLKRGQQYFKENLQQPLTDVLKTVISVGTAMAKAFSGPLIAALETVANLFSIIVKPLMSLVQMHGGILQIYATFKALSLLGFKGPSQGLRDIQNSLNPLHPSIFRLIGGFRELGSGLAKVGIALIVKGFIDARVAADNLHKSLNQAGNGDEFDRLNAKLARTANWLNISATDAKKLAAAAAEGPAGKGGTDVVLQQVKDAAALKNNYGMDLTQANDMISQQMKYLQRPVDRQNPVTGNQTAPLSAASAEREAADSIRTLKVAADSLGLTMKDITRLMSQFGQQAGAVGLGGTKGAPYIAALAGGISTKGFALNQDQLDAGMNTKDSLLQNMLSTYAQPSMDDIRKIGTNNLTDYYNLQGGSPALARGTVGRAFAGGLPIAPEKDGSGKTILSKDSLKATQQMQQLGDEFTTRQAQFGNQREMQAYVDKIAGGKQLKLPSMMWQGGLKTDVRDVFKPGQTNEQQAKRLAEEAKKADDALASNQKSVQKLNDVINKYNQQINALGQSSQVLQMQMQQMQHSWVGQQRQIEDLSLAVQKYSFENLHPLERTMARIGQASAEMGTKMNNAQYSMAKWNTGLQTGEQAALDSLHTMEKYNRSLQMMQLQYSQIGQELGKTTYEHGTKLRVEPLAGITLQQQSQVAQRRQQLAQLKYDATYGEGQYQMQQAARSRNERTERPLADRLSNIKQNVGVIDDLNVKQHDLQNRQAAVQSAMFKTSEKIQDMQDHIQTLSQALQDKQLHGGMRGLEDQSYNIGQETGKANIELTALNSKLAQVQQSVDGLKDRRQIFRDYLLSMIDFNGVDPKKTLERILKFGKQTKLLDPEQIKILNKALSDMGGAVKDDSKKGPLDSQTSFIEGIYHGTKRAFVGVFTGETWRSLSDQAKNLPGKLGDAAGASLLPVLATAASVGAGALIATGIASHVVKSAAFRPLAGLISRQLPESFGSQVGDIGKRIPGVRSYFSGGLERISEGGVAKELGRFASGGTGFLEGIKDSFKLLQRFRIVLGAGVGAAVGGMFGPAGAVIGATTMGRLANQYRLRDVFSLGSRAGVSGIKDRAAQRAESAAAKAQVKASEKALKAAEKAGANVDEAKAAVKEAKAVQDSHKASIKEFGKTEGRMATAIKGLRLRGLGKFEKAITMFAGSSTALRTVLNKIPGVHVADDVASTVAHTVNPTAAERELLKRVPGTLARVGKFAGRALGVASIGMAANDLLHGRIADAAQEAAVALPGRAGLWGVAGPFVNRGIASALDVPRKVGEATGKGIVAGSQISKAAIQGAPNLGANEMEAMRAQAALMDWYRQEIYLRKKKGEDVTKLQAQFDKVSQQGIEDLIKYTKDKRDTATRDEVQSWKDRLTYHQDSMKKLLDANNVGFKTIHSTTGDWLDKIVSQINRFNKKLGITTTVDDTGVPSDATTSNAAKHPRFAHGGIPQQHLIKGKGDGKGHLIRVGEEHDEVIIPLAPHRRERAKSLINQVKGRLGGDAHKCGPNCAKHGKYANGGFPGEDRAYHTAKGVYEKASASFANGGFTGPHGALAGLTPVANLAKQKFGLSVTAGRTDHSLRTTGGNVSDHSWGGAIDLSNGTSPTPQMDAWFQFARTKLSSVIKQLIYKHTLVNTGNAAGPYAANDHFNHVHTAILPQYANDAELTAKILSGAEKGVNITSLLTAVGSAASGLAASVRPQLKNVPKSLKKMGAVGKALYKALRKLKTGVANIKSGAAAGGSLDIGNFTGGGDAQKNMALGQRMAASVGWKGAQWQALKKLWIGESGWNQLIGNKSSGAYGIPQSLPGDKMASAGADWRTNPATQIKWGMNYIKGRYGDPVNALATWMGRSPHWYASGKKRIESPAELAVLHQGESVLNPAQAQHYADISEGKRGDMANPMTKKQTDALISIEDRIRKAVKHLESLDNKAIKQSDKKDLAALNLELRRKWGQIEAPSKTDRNISKAVLGAGDTTGGEGTAALVSKEQGILAKTEAGDIKKDNDLVKEMKNLSGIASSLLKHAQGPLQIKLAQIAVRATDRAKKSASAVTAYTKTKVGKAAVKEVARGKYIQGAAKRGVSDRLIKSITGKALSRKKVAVGRTASGKVRSVSQLGAYRTVQKARLQVNRAKATKDKRDDAPANKALTRALADLRKTTSAGFSKSAQHLVRLRSQAAKDAAKARVAVANSIKSQLKVKDLPPNIQKIVSKLSHGHALTSKEQKQLKAELAKHGIKGRATSHQLHDALRKTTSKSSKASASSINAHASAISAAVRAKMDKNHDGQISAAEKRAYAAREKLTDVSKKTKEGGDKTHDKIKEHIGKSKEQLDVAKKADDKKDKADSNQDKRERDFYKQALAHLDAISSKNFAVTVTNHATGATITSSVSSRARGK